MLATSARHQFIRSRLAGVELIHVFLGANDVRRHDDQQLGPLLNLNVVEEQAARIGTSERYGVRRVSCERFVVMRPPRITNRSGRSPRFAVSNKNLRRADNLPRAADEGGHASRFRTELRLFRTDLHDDQAIGPVRGITCSRCPRF